MKSGLNKAVETLAVEQLDSGFTQVSPVRTNAALYNAWTLPKTNAQSLIISIKSSK